ncbi:peroxisomal ATPase PEX6 isoform 2-T2 [Synchiropus picturatus]
MATQVELCCLGSFPSHLRPLEVLVLKSHLDSMVQRDTDPPTLMFHPQRPTDTPRSGVLLRVHSLTEEEAASFGAAKFPEEDPESSRVRIFTSRFFLQHHGLDTHGCSGTVQIMRPVPLERVTLGARSSEALRWASNRRFAAGLLELCGPGQWLLVRQGDPLLLGGDPGQSDLLVLECRPVAQGLITADTALVLTDCSDWSDQADSAPSEPPPTSRPLSLCVSDFAQYSDSLREGCSLLDNRKLLDLSGVLQALECRLDVRVVDSRRLREAGEAGLDVDGCVFVSRKMLITLGLFNQEWVRLSRPGASASGCRERLVAVATLVTDDSVALITDTLWFNLTGGDETRGCSLRIKRGLSCDMVPGRSSSLCRISSPPFATELHISPVSSPLYHNLNLQSHPDHPNPLDQLLESHFSSPRLVSVGDMLTVPVQNPAALRLNISDGVHRCPVLFFKVEKVSGATEVGAFLADTLHTSLYMDPCVQSSVPHCCCQGASLWTSLSPPGFSKVVDTLSDILRPHFSSGALSGCTVLLHGPAGGGKVTVASAASRRLRLHLLKVDCVTACADTPAASEAKLAAIFQRAEVLQPCVLLLRNLNLLLPPKGGANDDGRVPAALCQLLSSAPSRVAVVATVSHPRELSASVMAAFVHQMALESPVEEQRRALLVSLSRDLPLGRDVQLETLAKITTGFVLSDLQALLVQAGHVACRRILQTCRGWTEAELCSSGVTIQNQDFLSALETLQGSQSKSVGAPEIPRVRWEDVGGLQLVKQDLLDTVQRPLQHPELLSLGLTRTGILLYGPPGTGKTLLAKAVATECSMTFLSVKGPELINMYVGQSEQNVREVFSKARSAAPCIVFFDELDSLAPSRGRSGDSGGVMDRVVSQLLAELDALSTSVAVFVIGATNRPDLLDQSLLRPGRFDKLVYVGVNEDRSSQLQVLQAVLRRFQLDPGVDLQQLLERCPAHMTGADIYALCSDAMTAAVKRKIALIQDGLDVQDSAVCLSGDDFSVALQNLKPSVTQSELQRYKDIQQSLTAH